MKKYNSYSNIGVKSKFILCFNITSSDDLSKHDIYLYGKIMSQLDEFLIGDISENIRREMSNQLIPNSNITSEYYNNVVDKIVKNEGIRVMKML